jgi:hypothetical protein
VRAREIVLAAALALASAVVAVGGGTGSAAVVADAVVIAGSADFAPGPVRLSFLVLKENGQAINRPTARVSVARLDGKPFARTTATLEPIGVRGSEPAANDVTRIYVAHFRVPKPGIYTIVVEPVGAKPSTRGELHIQVNDRTRAPAVGAKAIASKTPTIASTKGDFAKLTTRTPPDRALLRYSVAGSLRAHKPFVVVFATPKFCSSRTCGPVVDVVEAVGKEFATTPIRFIHVEIYKDNNPGLGYNQWVKQWRLPSEPFTFLVGRDGRIKARFEGSVSVQELASAVRRTLT